MDKQDLENMSYEQMFMEAPVSRWMLQEYYDLTHAPKTKNASEAAEKRKAEIRMHIFTEAFSQFCFDHGADEPELTVVKDAD